jgi:hypothetical protein
MLAPITLRELESVAFTYPTKKGLSWMGWRDWAALIGAGTGVLSVFGLIYVIGWKLGNIETRLGNVESNQIDKEGFGRLSQRVETMYDIYIVDQLRAKPRKRGSSGGE